MGGLRSDLEWNFLTLSHSTEKCYKVSIFFVFVQVLSIMLVWNYLQYCIPSCGEYWNVWFFFLIATRERIEGKTPETLKMPLTTWFFNVSIWKKGKARDFYTWKRSRKLHLWYLLRNVYAIPLIWDLSLQNVTFFCNIYCISVEMEMYTFIESVKYLWGFSCFNNFPRGKNE